MPSHLGQLSGLRVPVLSRQLPLSLFLQLLLLINDDNVPLYDSAPHLIVDGC